MNIIAPEKAQQSRERERAMDREEERERNRASDIFEIYRHFNKIPS